VVGHARRLWTAALFPAVLATLAPSAAQARNGGIYLELAPSWGFYMTDEVIIEDGDDSGSPYPQAGFTPQLNVGFNMFGLAGAELNVAAHGWDLGRVERGGGGFIGGTFRMTPLELLSFVMPDDLRVPILIPPETVTFRDRPFDIGIKLGGGYTLVGEDFAYQGGYFQWGFDVKWFITPHFAIGLDLPFRQAILEPFRYVDYADSRGFCTDGADATGAGGVDVVPDPDRTRFFDVEIVANDLDSQCDGRAPEALLFAPSFTIAGVFDFGI
jgi:hypothetical protein